MKIGAHLSSAGGHENALKKAVEVGANCLQIFLSSPRGWNFARLEDDYIKSFNKKRKELQIDPIYFHASYLINLADTGRVVQLSKNLLVHELKVASTLGIKGSIIHLGSYKDTNKDDLFNEQDSFYNLFIANIKEILSKTPEDTYFIIENAGNKKIGLRLEEIGDIIKDIGNPRVRVCLDTCHLHAAGYDLSSAEKLDSFLNEFDKLIGLKNLELIHLNDSKDPLGSFRDRHENIGKGNVGEDVFKLLVNHPKLQQTSFILEVPGYDDKGPDKENIDIVKSFIRE